MSGMLKILSAVSLVLMAICIAGAAGAISMPGTYTVLQVAVCWVLFVIFGAVSLITGFAADQVQKEKPPSVREHLGRQTKYDLLHYTSIIKRCQERRKGSPENRKIFWGERRKKDKERMPCVSRCGAERLSFDKSQGGKKNAKHCS